MPARPNTKRRQRRERDAVQQPSHAPTGDTRHAHGLVPVSVRVVQVQGAALEDRIAAQHRQIQALLIDNQQLAAAQLALNQDLSVAQQDLRRLSTFARDLKAERDAKVREAYENSLKLEGEVRQISSVALELDRVQTDIQKLSADRNELGAELQAIESNVVRARAESKQVPAVKAEIEAVRQELQKGRSAIEYEKKNQVRNLEISRCMERNIVLIAREIDKLQSELSDANNRDREAAANHSSGQHVGHGNPKILDKESPCPNSDQQVRADLKFEKVENVAAALEVLALIIGIILILYCTISYIVKKHPIDQSAIQHPLPHDGI